MKTLRTLVLAAAFLAAASTPGAAQAPAPSPSPSPGASGTGAASGAPYVPQVQQTEVGPAPTLPAPTLDVPEAALRPLTAEEAAHIALAHHSDVVVAATGVQAAAGRTQAAQAALNPRLRLAGSYTDNLYQDSSISGGGANLGAGAALGGGAGALGGGANLGGIDSYTASATVNQLLFDFGYTRNLVRQARFLETAAGANLTRVQADLVLQVKGAFYNYIQTQRLVEVAEQNLANQREHLEQARGRFDAGIGLPADVTRSETAVSEAIFNLAQARTNAQVARVNLATLMGIDPRIPLEAAPSHEPAPEAVDPQYFFNRALEVRPEIAQLNATIQANQAGLEAAQNLNSPTLTAALGVNRFGAASFYQDQVNLTLGVGFDVLDGGARAGRVKEAQANVTSAEAQLQGVRERVVAEVARAWLNLETAEQRVAAATAQEANARETLRLATGRYRAGLGILLDVLDAQQALVTAETNRVNAEAVVELARATLNHAIGRPLAGGLP